MARDPLKIALGSVLKTRPMMPETWSLRPSSADERLLSLRLRRLPQVISRELGECLMLIDVDKSFL